MYPQTTLVDHGNTPLRLIDTVPQKQIEQVFGPSWTDGARELLVTPEKAKKKKWRGAAYPNCRTLPSSNSTKPSVVLPIPGKKGRVFGGAWCTCRRIRLVKHQLSPVRHRPSGRNCRWKNHESMRPVEATPQDTSGTPRLKVNVRGKSSFKGPC